MNKQQKTSLLIIILGLLLIAVIVYFFFLKGPWLPGSIVEEPDLPLVQLPSGESPEDNLSTRPRRQEYDISKEAKHEINATDVAKIASAFAERLGSYSNQSNYANFEDLNIFMTESMRDWAVNYITKMRADNPYDGNYYGITTTAISNKVVQFDDSEGTAEIIITTQKKEVSTLNGESSYVQDLRLVFVKENNQWLVDGAYWLK